MCPTATIGRATPTPLQLFWLVAVSAAAQVGIARAFAMEPQVMLLDERTSVDPFVQQP